MTPTANDPASGTTEQYVLGYAGSSMEWMASRTAEHHGRFLLDRLDSGMQLLDCGCGPGTLTAGFAPYIAPGDAVGVDRELGQTAGIQARARAAGIDNLRFVEGNVYALPFPDESFDVVFGSAILGSLARPADVVAEMVRVARPGAIVALKEFDHGGDLIWPQSPAIETSIELYHRLRASNGQEPRAGRRLREFLHGAGCRVDYFHLYYDEQVEPATLVPYIERNNRLFREVLGPQYYERGWCTPEEMECHIAAWRAFAENSAAIYCSAWAEAIGIKPHGHAT